MFNITSSSTPTAVITTKKGRLKSYGNKVYLNNGTQFEIELFNPKTTPVLAKIKLNGSYISSAGLILKPGQRVFLERFIDVDKKFKFETYDVENSAEANAAIANNGLVEVEFYDEQVRQQHYWYCGNTLTINSGSTWYNGNSSTTILGGNTALYGSSTSGVGLVNCSSTFTSSVDMSAQPKESKETGRVEQGAKSDQKMETGYGNFNSWTSSTIKWHILPTSQKPVEVSEIRNYCPSCRTRIKKSSWKFCPSCGENLKD
jgi:hypothetical protein